MPLSLPKPLLVPSTVLPLPDLGLALHEERAAVLADRLGAVVLLGAAGVLAVQLSVAAQVVPNAGSQLRDSANRRRCAASRAQSPASTAAMRRWARRSPT